MRATATRRRPIARSKGYGFMLWFICGFFLGDVALLHSIFVQTRYSSQYEP